MDFTAKIEEVKVEEKIIVVEYFDPHGGDSKRSAIGFQLTDTVNDIKAKISRLTPHDFFDSRNDEKNKIEQGVIDCQPILDLQGETFAYRLDTFDNPIV
jgi:hypothetical protein